MEVKERILKEAEKLFFYYGIRRVTMDDVAKALSISKKTLYQYYADKDALVTGATQSHLEREKQEFEEIYNTALNSIEELYMVSRCVRKNLNDINPTVLFDLKRFHPRSWEYWIEFKEQYIFKSIVQNLNRGIVDGLFRPDIDPEIIANLRVWEIQVLFDNESFPPEKFDFKKVQVQLYDHFVYGIATEKGRKLYTEYLEGEKSETYV